MSRRMVIMLVLAGLFFGSIFAYKAFQGYMMKKYMSSHAMPPTTVSASRATALSWQPKLVATGNIRAVNGVDVTTEIAGLIKEIKFTPGQIINTNDLLLELNADTEIAQLTALEAQAELAQITYDRDKEQFAVQGVSQATLDIDWSNLKTLKAQVEQQKALIAKKMIRAPFKGRLGISRVNLGQYLNSGDKIVTLQSLDPIYVDFYLPQQNLPQVHKGQSIVLVIDTYPNLIFQGKITSINPKIDSETRNVEVEATLSNPAEKLFPGMFGIVEVQTGSPQDFITVPQTAISYNAFGDLVYILKAKEKDSKGNTVYIANQKFITVGETRGDQVQILKGLEKGDLVVTAGQLKLKNESLAVIDNTILPSNNPTSNPQNE
ncbi:MAG: efflux RND transporter periplasmic adaptor subunit [Proteobacteria bacterium]|nr:efflux RND transporter periplasmic adaptor subunit [Pseudomonadota bacterium]